MTRLRRVCQHDLLTIMGFLGVCAALVFGLFLLRPSYAEDPEVNMNATQLITSKGYPCEDYTVRTDDGFLLGVQRIPHGRRNQSAKKRRPVVFLQHGLLCSSTNWLTNLANESLAYILADAGYDVWLGNARGNFYSRKHVKYTPDQNEFWQFSWDEMAKYDMPAMVNFALNQSCADQLYWIGHSQGSLMAFAQLSQDLEFAKKIRFFFALGPVSTVGYMTSPLRYLAEFAPEIRYLFEIFGVKEFLPNDEITRWLALHLCTEETKIFCENFLFILCGYDQKQLNISRLPVYFTHSPAGTSVQDVVHFAQMVKSKKFEAYDWGSANLNMQHYNQTTPLIYNITNMKTPVALFWGDNDWLADPKDVNDMINKLFSLKYNYEYKDYDHLDFIWAMNAPGEVYSKIIDILKREEQERTSSLV